MPFSEKLKKLREENHYTQKYVAKHLNVARSTIAGYETKNLTHFHRLSNSSKKELLNFLQYLEQRDESTRSKSAL